MDLAAKNIGFLFYPCLITELCRNHGVNITKNEQSQKKFPPGPFPAKFTGKKKQEEAGPVMQEHYVQKMKAVWKFQDEQHDWLQLRLREISGKDTELETPIFPKWVLDEDEEEGSKEEQEESEKEKRKPKRKRGGKKDVKGKKKWSEEESMMESDEDTEEDEELQRKVKQIDRDEEEDEEATDFEEDEFDDVTIEQMVQQKTAKRARKQPPQKQRPSSPPKTPPTQKSPPKKPSPIPTQTEPEAEKSSEILTKYTSEPENQPQNPTPEESSGPVITPADFTTLQVIEENITEEEANPEEEKGEDPAQQATGAPTYDAPASDAVASQQMPTVTTTSTNKEATLEVVMQQLIAKKREEMGNKSKFFKKVGRGVRKEKETPKTSETQVVEQEKAAEKPLQENPKEVITGTVEYTTQIYVNKEPEQQKEKDPAAVEESRDAAASNASALNKFAETATTVDAPESKAAATKEKRQRVKLASVRSSSRLMAQALKKSNIY